MWCGAGPLPWTTGEPSNDDGPVRLKAMAVGCAVVHVLAAFGCGSSGHGGPGESAVSDAATEGGVQSTADASSPLDGGSEMASSDATVSAADARAFDGSDAYPPPPPIDGGTLVDDLTSAQ